MKIPYILLATMIFFSATCQEFQESIRQIDIHVNYLRSLYRNHRAPKTDVLSAVTRYDYANSYGYFKHSLVITCIADIQQQSSLEPFFALWETIRQNSQVDEGLLEECALLNITFFNNILDELSYTRLHGEEPEITVDEIIDIYNRLAAMPLSQLINLLNCIVDCVVEVLQEISIGQILFSWLQDPWWEPVLMISSYIIKWFMN